MASVAVTFACAVSFGLEVWLDRPDETVKLTVCSDGRFLVGRHAVDRQSLQLILSQQVKSIQRWGGKPVVLIQADYDSLHADVVTALDMSTEAGFESVRLATVQR